MHGVCFVLWSIFNVIAPPCHRATAIQCAQCFVDCALPHIYRYAYREQIKGYRFVSFIKTAVRNAFNLTKKGNVGVHLHGNKQAKYDANIPRSFCRVTRWFVPLCSILESVLNACDMWYANGAVFFARTPNRLLESRVGFFSLSVVVVFALFGCRRCLFSVSSFFLFLF